MADARLSLGSTMNDTISPSMVVDDGPRPLPCPGSMIRKDYFMNKSPCRLRVCPSVLLQVQSEECFP